MPSLEYFDSIMAIIMRTGTANLPLHSGKAPRWLFNRMVKLGGSITAAVVDEFGTEGFLERISDPYWFQSLGAVLGFDWHSSGVTTTTCGALKVALNRGLSDDLGLYVAGGKGGASRKAPDEIRETSDRKGMDPSPLVYASRMSAKVDSAALQDGYQIYHHNFFFDEAGRWSTVQQGMNDDNGMARRYHWVNLDKINFLDRPHSAICSDARGEPLNLADEESENNREVSVELSHENPEDLIVDLQKLKQESLNMPKRHNILLEDLNPKRLDRSLLKAYEGQPENFEDLLGTRGVGPKTIRALSLTAELVYGEKACFKDPARFSFAHGGKDGIPYPVDRELFDQTIRIFEKAIKRSELDGKEKNQALNTLENVSET